MTPASQPAFRFDPDRLNRIKDWMQRYVDEGKYPGSSVLIRQRDDEVLFHAAGLRNIARGLAFQRDTVVRLYSMTKPITSLAIMMLLERGLFHLDAPVSDFLPAFADMQALTPDARTITQTTPCATPTLHQLMTHTSGLSYPFNPGPLGREMDELGVLSNPDKGTLAEMCDHIAALPLAFPPGTRWEYSVSIDILGRVVEVVTGKSLADFLADEIFAPLGMNQTAFTVPTGTGDRFAALYSSIASNQKALAKANPGAALLRLIDAPGKSPYQAATMFSGGGGLVGTIDDYMRFTTLLRRGGVCEGGRLVSPSTLAFMMRNHLPGDIASMGPQSFAEQPMQGTGFGLGGAVVLDPARTGCPGNTGDFSWGGMASTFFWIDRTQDISVVFLTQLSPSSSYPSRSELKALIHGALV